MYCTEMCKCESDDNLCKNTIENNMESVFDVLSDD